MLTDKIPAGLKIVILSAEAGTPTALTPGRPFAPIFPKCTTVGQTYRCELEGLIRPAENYRMRIEAEVEPSVPLGSTLTNELSVEGGTTPGGEGPKAQTIYKKEMPVTDAPPKFADQPLRNACGKQGRVDRHPGRLAPVPVHDRFRPRHSILEPRTTTFGAKALLPFLAAQPRDLHFTLPPGFLGSVAKTPRCSGVDFLALVNGSFNACKPNTAIGFANAFVDEPLTLGPITLHVPIFNLTPNVGEPARFGFIAKTVPVVLTTHVRSGSDYAVEVSVHLLPESIEILNTEATFWGVPGAPEHNQQRSWRCLGGGDLAEYGEGEAEGNGECDKFEDKEPEAFLTLPTYCETAPESGVRAVAWTGQEFTQRLQIRTAHRTVRHFPSRPRSKSKPTPTKPPRRRA